MSISKRSPPSSQLLHTFHTVAQAGNVTKAAELLGRTQSAISLQVRKLEQTLAVSLFEREARGVELTEAGRRLLPLAQKIMTDINRVGALFEDPLNGKIRVGIPDDYGETILVRALAEFAARHEQVEVTVRSGCTADYPALIRRGELDLAIYSAGPMAPNEAFFSEPTVWAANLNLALAADKPVPLAVFDRHCWWRDVATNALDDVGRAWRVVYSSENFVSVRAAISAGLGVGILASSAVGPGMRILGVDEGFPELPRSSLALLKPEMQSSAIASAMEQAILASTLA